VLDSSAQIVQLWNLAVVKSTVNGMLARCRGLKLGLFGTLSGATVSGG
jgi:hypothetical protein